MPYKIAPPDEKSDNDIIKFLNKQNLTIFLGGGGESWVYQWDHEHIIRICKTRINPQKNKKELCPLEYATKRKEFYDSLNKYQFSFELPNIKSVEHDGNIVFTIENRIKGTSLHEAFIAYPSKRKLLLLNYFNAVKELDVVDIPTKEFGVAITPDKTIPYVTKSTWADYLFTTISYVIKENDKFFKDNHIDISPPIIQHIKNKIYLCFDKINKHGLVHGDIFPPNIMIDPETFKITGIIDFSDLTLIGDHILDIASTLLQTEYLDPYSEEYSKHMLTILKHDYGNELNEIINIYRLYYSFVFLTSKWCIHNLKNINSILESKSLWSPFCTIAKLPLSEASLNQATEDKSTHISIADSRNTLFSHDVDTPNNATLVRAPQTVKSC